MKKLNEKEVLALRAYFDNVSINMSAFFRKHGKETTNSFNAAIDKLYEDGNQEAKD
jgi:hypothetical protein